MICPENPSTSLQIKFLKVRRERFKEVSHYGEKYLENNHKDLRSCVGLAEDPSSVPSTHVR